MTNKEAIKVLQSMKPDFPLPKAAQTRRAQNDALDAAIKVLKAEPRDDTISRQAAIDCFWTKERLFRDALDVIKDIRQLPSAQPEVVKCKDCKYFELDHFEKVDWFPIPIIVAHEICMKWGNGCQSSVDGWCFMAERRSDER